MMVVVAWVEIGGAGKHKDGGCCIRCRVVYLECKTYLEGCIKNCETIEW